MKRIAGAAGRHPVWSAAAAAPFVPALAIALPVDRPASAAAAAIAALGLLAAVALLRTRRALEWARSAALVPRQPTRAQKPRRGADPPAERLRQIEQWRKLLDHGWSATAGRALAGIADDSREHPECRVQSLAALCAHRAERGLARRRGRTLEADVAIVSTLNLRGGTTSANEAEIRAFRSAGLTVALVHHPVFDRPRALGRRMNERMRALIDDERVMEVGADDRVRCELAIVRFPVALAHLMDDRPRIDAARTALLVNQTPFVEYGLTGGYGAAWPVREVHRNVTAWLGPHTWYPIGPAVRDALRDHHADELADIALAEDFWYETIDVADWNGAPRRRDRGGPIRIGRHSRDDVTKFPNMAKRLRAAYPAADDIEVHILGGHRAVGRILGAVPPEWTVHEFGAVPPAEFLAGIDVYVYFNDENLAEAFGRAPLEAMAAGVPCILQPGFAELFGDGALYCEPHEVEAAVRRLMDDPDHYAERSAAGIRTVDERFSSQALLHRVRRLGVEPRPALAGSAAPAPGGVR